MEPPHKSTRIKQKSSIKVVVAVAGEEIGVGVKSPVITVASPIDVSTVFWQEEQHATHVAERTLQITIEDECMTSLIQPNTWMKHVQLSGNCHVQNLQITFDSKGNLFLQAIRKIIKFEPLYAWFSTETSRMFNIPFLELKNIQGHQQYTCHHCDTCYQNPNPLKVHLAFYCNQANINRNQNRLQLPMTTVAAAQPFFQPHTSYSPFQSMTTTPQNRIPVSETNSTRISSYDSESRFGFLPIPNHINPLFLGHYSFSPTILTHHSNSQTLFSSLRTSCGPIGPPKNLSPSPPTSSLPLPPPIPTSKILVPESPLSFNSKVPTTNESTSESDLCNLKRRHKCCYCGKMYSRKYGLKIHIRTHTGYKPLKCKICLRPFGDPSNLNKHVRLHAEGTTRYRCDLCGKVLVRRRDLQRHLKSRHSNENFTEIIQNNEPHHQTTTNQ